MGIWGWISQNWFDLITVVGIVGGLWFTAVSLRSEAKTRRIANLLTLTQNHRALWEVFYQNVQLTRILDPSADIASLPVNHGEEIYTTALIQHLFSAYRAMQSDLTIKPEGLRLDVREFFELPFPKPCGRKSNRFRTKISSRSSKVVCQKNRRERTALPSISGMLNHNYCCRQICRSFSDREKSCDARI
jgi:hypothetical protein